MDRPISKKSICFVGTQSHFSATVFKVLLDQGVSITQVFCAGVAPAPKLETSPSLSVAGPNSIAGEDTLDSLANQHGIPIQFIKRQTDLSSLNFQQYTKPNFILIACFPFLLPESFIRWPESGCLNIHPSLLPLYRGPDPLFWQLRNGEPQTGVSLHLVTSKFDAGPIVKQKLCILNTGAERLEIEALLAKKGASLFAALLTADEDPNNICVQQDHTKSSYHHYPSVENFVISSDWSAEHAFNFIHGTCSPSGYYTIKTDNEILNIFTASDYFNGPTSSLPLKKDELLIQFSPGILRAVAI